MNTQTNGHKNFYCACDVSVVTAVLVLGIILHVIGIEKHTPDLKSELKIVYSFSLEHGDSLNVYKYEANFFFFYSFTLNVLYVYIF